MTVITSTIPSSSAGSPGVGVPAGGDTDQILSKIDATNYNTQWVDPLVIDGGEAYYFTNTASDLGGGRLVMLKGIPGGGGFGIDNLAVTNGALLAEFATVADYPSATYIPSGPMGLTVVVRKPAGTKVARIYAEFYSRSILGVSTLIATSNYSSVLTASNQTLTVIAKTEVVRNLLVTDRLDIIIRANVTGAGTDPDITIDIQGLTNSECKFPYESPRLLAGAGVTITPGADSLTIESAPPTGSNNSVAGYNGSGNLYSIPGWAVNAVGGLSVDRTGLPSTTNVYDNLLNTNLSLEPTEAAPNANWSAHNISLSLSNALFTMGTSGEAAKALNLYAVNEGVSDSGSITAISAYIGLGNGVDAIDVKGLTFANSFSNIADNVTVSGPIQGYGFQVTVDSAAVLTTNSYVQAFYDNANIQTALLASYTSFNANPQIAEVGNNANYSSLNVNPTIPIFSGNAGFTGIGIYGTLGTFGTGGYTGININPTITSVVNAQGLRINMSNVSASGSKRAIDATGDVNVIGRFDLTGNSQFNGSVDAFFSEPLTNGGGNPDSGHTLITQPTVAANVTLANADYIGVNTAMLLNIGANATVTTAFLGVAAAAIPAVVEVNSGATVDHVAGGAFALALSSTASAGGIIDQVMLCQGVAIPNGLTTVNNLYGYYMDLPFGNVGTTQWGVYIKTSTENYMAGSLKIGGADTVTNSSIGLEMDSKAIRLATMDTTARNALTAVAGMMIFNTTTATMQYYDGSSWV